MIPRRYAGCSCTGGEITSGLVQRMKKETGSTLIPLEIYFKRGYAKVLLAVAQGKAQYDKRAAIKDRDAKPQLFKKALRALLIFFDIS